MNRNVLFGCFLMFMGLLLIQPACSSTPGKEGEKCATSADCEEGLYCSNDLCRKRKTYESTTEPTEEKAETEPKTEAPGEEKQPDASAEPAPDDTPDNTQQEPAIPDNTQVETQPEPQVEKQPENTNTEPQQPDQAPSGLRLYDVTDPSAPNRPAQYSVIEVKNVVITTPSVRLSSKLNAFFVQELTQRNGSFKYGGVMVVHDRSVLPVSLAIGTIVSVKGKFYDYRYVDWNSTCTTGLDCLGQTVRNQCLDVYNTQTSQLEKHCAEGKAMPQIELVELPKSLGSSPTPTPEVLSPFTLQAAAQSYRGVLVKVENVKVSSANPDAPKDYSEFEITDAGNLATVRVDDMINTITYTGSKFCSGCNSGNPDQSYCLPGDTCQCQGSDGRCYTGSPQSDVRKVGDEFEYIIGVLRFANSHHKLLPRIPTDMKKK
ncbi:MAG: hypothetical protein CL920_10615 [Deltaproteobacteria bacterium]|nr:hypothetical protein [Deltaproteobacteria bacterium]|tara:strand:+ start:1818 stop:3110 length:1293 start_codon:yes stop_codon:yes gene_type:complete